jgi:hypothetical protein
MSIRAAKLARKLLQRIRSCIKLWSGVWDADQHQHQPVCDVWLEGCSVLWVII